MTRLASRLGVTPGSFYWHFEGRDQFRDRLLQHWQAKMLRSAVAATRDVTADRDRIRALPTILASRGLPALDAAMRRWGAKDPAVRAAVGRADGLRLQMTTELFRAVGQSPETAAESARILGWAFRGSIGAPQEERFRTLTTLIDKLVG